VALLDKVAGSEGVGVDGSVRQEGRKVSSSSRGSGWEKDEPGGKALVGRVEEREVLLLL